MVVRLVGDGSSFVKMMTGAAATARATAGHIEASLTKVERFASTLLGTFGSLGLAASIRGVFDQFATLERGQIRLSAAITAGGHDATELTTRYRAVAESISAVTLNTKNEVLALFQKAEIMGFSGDQAERVVRNSVALAAATGNEASSMIRGVAASERGNLSLLRRQLQLQGVKDETELVTKINQRMAMGMAVATAEFNSASGKMERLGRSMKSVGQEIGGLIAGMILPFVSFTQKLVEGFKSLDDSTKKMTYKVVGLTLAWLGMAPVTNVLRGILHPITSLLYYLVVTVPVLALYASGWAICKTVMIGFSVAVAVVKGAALVLLGVLNLLIGALTVSTALFSGLSVVLLAGGFALLVGGFKFLMSAVPAVFSSIRDLVSGISSMRATSTPLSAISRTFSEWVTIIKEVVIAAQTNLPAAWQLLSAGFTLAVNQVRDLWPPIWNYVKEGFLVVIEFIGQQVSAMASNMALRFRISSTSWMSGQNTDALLAEVDRSERAIRNSQLSLATNALARLQFNSPGESDATRAAREAVEMARANIAEIASRAAPAAENAGVSLGAAMNKGMKSELHKFDAVRFGSAEALSRIEEYSQRFFNPNRPPAGSLPASAASTIPVAPRVTPYNDVVRANQQNANSSAMARSYSGQFASALGTLGTLPTGGLSGAFNLAQGLGALPSPSSPSAGGAPILTPGSGSPTASSGTSATTQITIQLLSRIARAVERPNPAGNTSTSANFEGN